MRKRVVTLDRRAIAALAARPSAVAAFPVLARKEPAGCCGKRPGPAVGPISAALAVLPDSARERLKELVGADEVVLFLPTGGEVRF